jgi:hypothetical protein
MTAIRNPAAGDHIQWFLASPDGSDGLLIATAVIVALAVFGVGLLFFTLHSLPERMGHKKLQFEIVAVLGLLSLFTHIHLFWVIGLLLALIDIPDLTTPLQRIAAGVETLSGVSPSEAADTQTAEKHPAKPPKGA